MMKRWLGREPTHTEVVVALICITVLILGFIGLLVLDDWVTFNSKK